LTLLLDFAPYAVLHRAYLRAVYHLCHARAARAWDAEVRAATAAERQPSYQSAVYTAILAQFPNHEGMYAAAAEMLEQLDDTDALAMLVHECEPSIHSRFAACEERCSGAEVMARVLDSQEPRPGLPPPLARASSAASTPAWWANPDIEEPTILYPGETREPTWPLSGTVAWSRPHTSGAPAPQALGAAGARAFMVLEAEHMTAVLATLEFDSANEGAAACDTDIAELARAAGAPPRRTVMPPWDASKVPVPFFDSSSDTWTGSREAILAAVGKARTAFEFRVLTHTRFAQIKAPGSGRDERAVDVSA
jgi:hypothetical protein